MTIDCQLAIPNDLHRRFDDRLAFEAAGRGVFNLVRRHLVERNRTRPKRGDFPHSNYWARRKVDISFQGRGTAVIQVGSPGDGVALHYHGGIVRPRAGHKYLAIPADRSVWDVKPSEYKGKVFFAKRKGAKSGTLRDWKTKKVLWFLVPEAHMKADKTVIPEMRDMVAAGQKAAMAAMGAVQ